MNRIMKKRSLIAGTLAMLLLVNSLWAADNGIESHPGFVDFSSLTALTSGEPTVEISLKAPLLNMVTNLIRSEDEQAADFISKLLRVTVNVFDRDGADLDAIASTMDGISADLDAQGWERVVRVRESEDHVDIFVRMSPDAEVIHGLAIMVVGNEETVMVNIVGDINGNDLAALGRRFDIDELEGLEVPTD